MGYTFCMGWGVQELYAQVQSGICNFGPPACRPPCSLKAVLWKKCWAWCGDLLQAPWLMAVKLILPHATLYWPHNNSAYSHYGHIDCCRIYCLFISYFVHCVYIATCNPLASERFPGQHFYKPQQLLAAILEWSGSAFWKLMYIVWYSFCIETQWCENNLLCLYKVI